MLCGSLLVWGIFSRESSLTPKASSQGEAVRAAAVVEE